MIYIWTKKIGVKYLYFNIPYKLAQYFKSFGLMFHRLKEKPPTKENLKERRLIEGYFKQSKLEPYMLSIEEAEKVLGV